MKSKKSMFLFSINIMILLVGTLSFNPTNAFEVPEDIVFDGSMFVSDAGIAFGGFEWTASYTATLTLHPDNLEGDLNVSLEIGLGSGFEGGVESVELNFTDFTANDSHITFSVGNYPVVANYTPVDKIWNGTWNGFYIAAQSLNSSEIKGEINPLMFPGFVEFFYVELRLHPRLTLTGPIIGTTGPNDTHGTGTTGTTSPNNTSWTLIPVVISLGFLLFRRNRRLKLN